MGLYYRIWEKNPGQIMDLGRETVAFIVGGIKKLFVADDTNSSNYNYGKNSGTVT